MFLTLINHDFKIKSFYIYKIIIKKRPSYEAVKEWKMVISLLIQIWGLHFSSRALAIKKHTL
jgi:hypothetical protein